MTASGHRSRRNREVVVVGGGHNGLVAAAYLGRAGIPVTVVEARDRVGGPAATYEFLPGYRCSFTNSPGSFEPSIVADLELRKYGLEFVQVDPTLVHPFHDDVFIGWRDASKVDDQLEHYRRGEAHAYRHLVAELEALAPRLGVSLFKEPDALEDVRARLTAPADLRLFDAVFHGSLWDVLHDRLTSSQGRALMGMVGLNATFRRPTEAGTAIGLLLRPLSLASREERQNGDPRRIVTRGATGLPIGGMGAIVDALRRACERHGVKILTNARVIHIGCRSGRVTAVALEDGRELDALVVIAAVNPRVTFGELLDPQAVDVEVRDAIASIPMGGSPFKVVLALDALPTLAPDVSGSSSTSLVGTQFRICPSLEYLDQSIVDAQSGVPSQGPIMWGLIPSVTSPTLAPKGKHVLSLNVWHAPLDLAYGDWTEERERFGKRCVDLLRRLMPDIENRVIDHRFMSPLDIAEELNLVGGNITHGDMVTDRWLASRPVASMSRYRTPIEGLYLSGAGTWPGGYVSGIPGHNASAAVIADLASGAM